MINTIDRIDLVSGAADLSGGAIAGIVIGCVVGVALIAAVALYLARHHDFANRSRV